MRTNKIIGTVFFVLFLAGGYSLQAQQAPKKAAPKSTTQKPAVKKKPAKKAKAGVVYICDGTGGYFFHSRKNCATLAKCKGRILDVSKQTATGQYSTKQCKNCY